MPTVDDLLGPDPTKQDPEKAGIAAGLPAGLFPAVVGVESGGRDVVSNKGAVGPAQVLPASGANPGYGIQGGNPRDINTGARILAGYIKKAGGDVAKGLEAYNAGFGNPKAGKDYANKVISKWKPSVDALLGADPSAQSPLASRPPQAAQPQQQQQQQPAPKPEVPQSIMEAMNRPADRTVELMQQSVQQTAASIDALIKHPGLGTATNAALNVIGLPFSPVTSVVDAFVGDPAVQLAHSLGVSPKADPYIRQAAQAILPIAGTRSAMVQQALGAEGQFLAGSLTPGAPELKPGQQAAKINAGLIRHDQQAIARNVERARNNDQFFKLNPQFKQYDEEIYHAGEDPNVKLSPQAAAFKKAYLDPRKKEFDAYVQEAQRLGVTMPKDMTDLDRYMHRQAIERPEPMTKLQRVGAIVDPNNMLNNTPPSKGFGVKPDIFQTPLAGKVTSALTGEEGGYHIDPESNVVDIYKNGKVIDHGTVQDKTIVTKNGGVWDMSRGTTKEIEQHTPVRYYKSAAGSITEAQSQIADVVANARFLKGLKSSPEFVQLAHPGNMPSPRDWRTVDIPGYTGFEGYKFQPKLANVLEDYTGLKQDHNALMQGINRVVQGSIFLDPMKHLLNVEFHAAIQAGLFGGMSRLVDGGVRLMTPGEQTLTHQAIMGVINKDDKYLSYVRESPGLKGANNYVRDYGNRLLKQMGKDPKMMQAAQPLAQVLGMKPAQLVAAMYRGSNATLWGVGDMILYRGFLASETEHGGTIAQTAASVGEHVPTYVIPPEILGSRALSEIMRHPWFMGFSRYEYNRLASYGNLMKGVVKPSALESRGQVADQIAALAFHFAVTYPLVNAGIQHVTGNKNASLGWFGPYSYPGAIKDYTEGKKDIAQATTQTAVRPSAAVETLMEAYYGTELWKQGGKSIYHSPGDFGKYLMSKTYPTQTLMNVVTPKKGVTPAQAVRQFALDFVGIKDPTPQQEAMIRKYAALELKKRQKP